MGRSKTVFVVASVGVGLVIGGGIILMSRRFKSRLRLIAERVELMEDQICDLKDLVNDMIKEENLETKMINHNLKESLQSKIDISRSSCSNKVINKSEVNLVKYDSSLEDEEDFVEALEGCVVSDYYIV